MQRNNWLITISIIVVLILINNTIYYYLTRDMLEQALNDEMLRNARQIERFVEQSRLGSELFEDQIGRELRTSSIAIQYALDPDIDKVTNEQLTELSRKLDIKHITLLKRVQDDIILDKSSDATQPGQSTKSWVPWFSNFNQLFDNHNVTTEWLGQTYDNFWSGPYEIATTDLNKVYKWGYYYDGTTNYIIDPYVDYSVMKKYEDTTGVNRIIDDTIAASDSILEIAVLNPKMFPEGNYTKNDEGQLREHILQRPILYGSYTYKSPQDIDYVQEAFTAGKIVTKKVKVGERHLVKMFIPVFLENNYIQLTNIKGDPLDSYVLSIVADKALMEDKLSSQFLNLGVIITVVSGLSLMIAIVALRYYRQSKDKAVRLAQETYIDEINGLFHSIRAQRHDFINHVQTIRSLAELNKTSALVAYTKELTKDIRDMNDMINIGNPAIAALIRSKISQAESHHIEMECVFDGLNTKEMGAKTLDVNRIIGNLIDNAFDEVLKYDQEERKVTIAGTQTAAHIEFIVSNRCRNAKEIVKEPLFKAGYTTKVEEHQGLGLVIVNSIIERYKGEMRVTADTDDTITFTVKLPL